MIIPEGASVPPRVGEYGYFLSKHFNNINNDANNKNKKIIKYYKIKIHNHDELIVPCHYSENTFTDHGPFRISWGKISKVVEVTEQEIKLLII
jgi:hypothetical protein